MLPEDADVLSVRALGSGNLLEPPLHQLTERPAAIGSGGRQKSLHGPLGSFGGVALLTLVLLASPPLAPAPAVAGVPAPCSTL
jgi:hypothetical protein